MSRLRVAVIGSGLIANVKHIPAWQRLKDQADLTSLCDLDLQQAQRVARKFGIPNVYSDLDELFGTERPDVVDICTPPKTHCFIAEAAMSAGCHVMIEKPMAITLEECDRIIAVARQNNVKVCCGHSDLFYLAYTEGRRMVADGRIGAFRGMRIFLSTPRDYITSKPDHWGNKLPGGVIGETGPHVIYMTLPFIPRIKEVGVSALKILEEYPWSPYEDYRLDLVGEKAISSITLAYTGTDWLCQLELLGDCGILRLDLETQSVVLYKRADLRARTAALSQLREATQLATNTVRTGFRYATGRVPGTHAVMASRFVQSIRNGTASPVPAEEGRETVRVLALITQQLDQKYGPAT